MWSHCTPGNMTEDVMEQYNTFNTKVFSVDLIFGDFNSQPIPSTYYDLTNYCYDDGTEIDADMMYNEGVEDTVLPNGENNDVDRLASEIEPPPKQYSVN